jgi:hypothetical protein
MDDDRQRYKAIIVAYAMPNSDPRSFREIERSRDQAFTDCRVFFFAEFFAFRYRRPSERAFSTLDIRPDDVKLNISFFACSHSLAARLLFTSLARVLFYVNILWFRHVLPSFLAPRDRFVHHRAMRLSHAAEN